MGGAAVRRRHNAVVVAVVARLVYQNVSKLVRGLGLNVKRLPYRCIPITPNRSNTNNKKIPRASTVLREPSTPLMILQQFKKFNHIHTHTATCCFHKYCTDTDTDTRRRKQRYIDREAAVIWHLITTGNLLRIRAILSARNTLRVLSAEKLPAPMSKRDTSDNDVITKSKTC